MTDWQPIKTAPKDGTPIRVKIPGNGDNNVIAWHWGFLDCDGEDCGGWVIHDYKEPPLSWHDGVCWEVNESGIESTKPTQWMLLSESQEMKEER